MLKVGKVGLKVRFKPTLGAGLILQDLIRLDLWGWVQDKSRVRHG